jgi:hypothetical protein
MCRNDDQSVNKLLSFWVRYSSYCARLELEDVILLLRNLLLQLLDKGMEL